MLEYAEYTPPDLLLLLPLTFSANSILIPLKWKRKEKWNISLAKSPPNKDNGLNPFSKMSVYINNDSMSICNVWTLFEFITS